VAWDLRIPHALAGGVCQQEIQEWDRRRKEAEARGEEFTEPPPTQPQEKSQENSKE